MPTVGEQLRAAREQANQSVHQVAEATKIKTDHIRAIEGGNWGAFNAPVYIRGFVRCYATHLKLDVPRVMIELGAELGQTRDFAEPPSLGGGRKGPLDFLMLQLSRIKWQIVFPLLLLAVLGAGLVFGLRAWKEHQRRDPLSGLGSGLYQPSKVPLVDTLSLPTNAPPRR